MVTGYLQLRRTRVAGFCAAILPATLVGALDYVTRIDTTEVFESVTMEEGFRDDLVRTGKYLAPARDDPALLHTVYQNVNILEYRLHISFMSTVFGDYFPNLDIDEYKALVQQRATRQYWAGVVYQIIPREGACRYGFTVFTVPGDPNEVPTEDDVFSIVTTLSESFTIGELCYVPDTELAREKARQWTDPPFSIYFLSPDSTVTYEAYTTGTACGRVRLLTAAEVEEASAAGLLSWQEIVVIDTVPAFLETIVSGIVTGGRQGELSHLNVRAARRGTPNVYVQDPHEAFEPYEGQLVRIEFGSAAYEMPVIVGEAEADAWWQEHRPHLTPSVLPDFTWTDVTSLAEMDGEKAALVARFGAKAANLSILNRCLPEEMQLPGFAIPVHWYDAFLERNTMLDRRFSPPRPVTFKAYIASMLQDDAFRTDSALRAATLAALREEMRSDSVMDADLNAALAEMIEAVFGGRDVMVRFRSSSNMEDDLEFNGAGLYDSTSVCALDSFDGNGSGPSLCDAEKLSERTIARGLRKVWASLWNVRAYEEREYYQLPHDAAAMAILVTPAFPREAANGVAFTGDPMDPSDKQYLINVQQGDESVVNPNPAIIPEKDILEMAEGQVSRIVRARPSSLVAPGTYVLSDAQLRELGATMAVVEECFPLDTGPFDPARVIIDLEFKFTSQGALVLKQARPFLITELPGPTPTFELVIPEATAFEGVHLFDRTLDIEQRLLSTGRFRSGVHALPTNSTVFSGDLIEELWIGSPDQQAVPQGDGEFSFVVTGTASETPSYEFTYQQLFSVTGTSYELFIKGLEFSDTDAGRTLVFNEQYLSETGDVLDGLDMVAAPVNNDDYHERIAFGGAGYPGIPLRKITIEGGGETVELAYRLWQLIQPNATGPANLVRAQVDLTEGSREVTDYWHLVYAAAVHNEDQRFRVLLDPPLGAVHAVEVHEGFGTHQRGAYTLGADMQVLRTLTIDRYEEILVEDPRGARFRRGDANADGRMTISDAVSLLNYLFTQGSGTACQDALDTDDDGSIQINDAVLLLAYLFTGGPRPAMPLNCNWDPTRDDPLTCESFGPCPRL